MSGANMTHQFDDTEPVDVAKLATDTDAVFGSEPVAPAPTSERDDFLARMRAERTKLVERVAKLVVPIPSWDKRLIATFTPMDDAKRKRLGDAQQRLRTDDDARVWMCGMIGETCTGLTLDGHDIGSGLYHGFGPDFGFIVDLPANASQADLVWSAFNEDETALGTFRNGLTRWFADPLPLDLSNEVDVPFGSA